MTKRGRAKIKRVVREFSKGKLRSSSGRKVRSKRQALAIGYSYARKMK